MKYKDREVTDEKQYLILVSQIISYLHSNNFFSFPSPEVSSLQKVPTKLINTINGESSNPGERNRKETRHCYPRMQFIQFAMVFFRRQIPNVDEPCFKFETRMRRKQTSINRIQLYDQRIAMAWIHREYCSNITTWCIVSFTNLVMVSRNCLHLHYLSSIINTYDESLINYLSNEKVPVNRSQLCVIPFVQNVQFVVRAQFCHSI